MKLPGLRKDARSPAPILNNLLSKRVPTISMKSYLLVALSTIAAISCGDNNTELNAFCPQGYLVEGLGLYQFEEKIFEGVPNLKKLTVRGNKTVYYTFQWEDDIRRVGYITLHDKENHIVDLNNTNTIGLDYNLDSVYIGSDNGFFKLEENGSVTKFHKTDSHSSIATGSDVLHIAMYKNKIILLRKGNKIIMNELEDYDVVHMTTNKDGNMVVLTKDGAVGVIGHRTEFYNMGATTIAIARDDTIYFSGADGLYRVGSDYIYSHTLTRVNEHLRKLQGLEFINDNNDIIFAVDGSIYKYKRVPSPCL